MGFQDWLTERAETKYEMSNESFMLKGICILLLYRIIIKYNCRTFATYTSKIQILMKICDTCIYSTFIMNMET